MMPGRKEFMKLKQPDPAKIAIHSVQESLEIKKVSLDGTFQVGDNLYSRSYILDDVSYRIKEYKEQLLFLEQWCKIINTFECSIKIGILNRKRDLEYLKKYVLYHEKKDGLDSSRDAYNDIIWNKVVNDKNGLEQVKILTVCIRKDTYHEAVNALDSAESNLIKDFGYLQSALVPLDGNARLKLLHNIYYMDQPSEFQLDLRECLLSGRDWKNEFSPVEADFTHPDYFKINDKWLKANYLVPSGYPSSLSDEFYYELCNLPFVSMINMDYVPIPKNIVKKTLETKYMGVESDIAKQLSKKRQHNDFVSDISYKLRKEKEDIEGMLDDINDNDQKMFWIGVTILIAADSMESLKQNESMVQSIVDKYSCRLMNYNLRQREAFNTAMPIGVRQVNLLRAMFTQTACILNPFAVQELQNTESCFPPMYYGINRISKNAILENRKNLINGNGFVFGVPGGGKSFTGSKLEMGSVFLNTTDDIIVVDPTLEYFDVADSFGGEKLKLSLDTTMYFNPLDVNIEELKRDTETVISDKSQLIQGICEQVMEGRMHAGHATIVDRSVRHMYRRIAADEDGVNIPIMSDLYQEIEKQPEDEKGELLLALELFVDGSYNIFNHPTNVDMKNRLTVYGMCDLQGNTKLSGVSMLIILENIKSIINKNAARGIATWLYIDEIHILLKSPYSRDYLITLFKLVRKLGGICTGITQNVCDLIKDDDTSTLISNCEYTMFLKQAAPDAALLLKTFTGMNREHINYVSNAVPGTGLIRFGGTIIPMDNRIDKGNPIYDVFNTNLHEKAAQTKARMAKEKAMEGIGG